MLTVSLHGIRIQAPHGLYKEEHVLGNVFEIDVDVWLSDVQPWPFADYSVIQSTVAEIFGKPEALLETLVYSTHATLKQRIEAAEKIRVAVRKLNPPLPGEVAYSQVCYEK